MTRLFDRLNRYYRRHDIHPLEFQCIHRASCAAGCAKFTEAKASLVGSEYGDPIRIVVLSLDPGSCFDPPRDRTLEAIQAKQSRERVEKLHKGHHWYRTHETVAALLSLFDTEFTAAEAACRFAHVNAAKCTHNLPARKQAPTHLFENCRPYLEGELAILAPEIVVTQGDRAAAVIEPWTKRGTVKNLVEMGDRTFYWLRLVHPTAWGGAYGREKKTWPRQFGRAKKWIDAQA